MKGIRGPLTWETAPDILTVEEAAELVRIPKNAAYEAIRLGFLPAHNFGERRTRVAKSALRQVFGLKPQDKGATAAFSHTGGEQ
ncbi:MAG: helix-turn-helix domain-containing protein [Candidatus Cybelea sp.]